MNILDQFPLPDDGQVACVQLEVAFVEAVAAGAGKAQEMGKVLGFRIKRDDTEPVGDHYVFLLFHKRIIVL